MDTNTYFLIGGFIFQFLIQGAVFLTYVRFELRQLRLDMEKADTYIEDKRLANVDNLKVIYNQKIEDSRKYAKGLVEIQAGEFKGLNEKIVVMQGTLTQILNLLMKNGSK
jgi:hypothetical protein